MQMKIEGDIDDLTELTELADADLVPVQCTVGGVRATRKVTIATLATKVGGGGGGGSYGDADVRVCTLGRGFTTDIAGEVNSGDTIVDAFGKIQNALNAGLTAYTTDNLTEGESSFYWTQDRFDAAFTAKSTSDLTEGTRLYYTAARFNTAFGSKTTDDLAEGLTKLYYTDARADARITAQKGVANGLATLDGSTKIPTSLLPASVVGGLQYQSSWNPATNSPALTSSTGTKGQYYVASTAGTTTLDGISEWKAKDWVVFNGTTWEKVDNTDNITSVNGMTGIVMLGASDVGALPITGGTLTGDLTIGFHSLIITGVSGGAELFYSDDAGALLIDADLQLGSGKKFTLANSDGSLTANVYYNSDYFSNSGLLFSADILLNSKALVFVDPDTGHSGTISYADDYAGYEGITISVPENADFIIRDGRGMRFFDPSVAINVRFGWNVDANQMLFDTSTEGIGIKSGSNLLTFSTGGGVTNRFRWDDGSQSVLTLDDTTDFAFTAKAVIRGNMVSDTVYAPQAVIPGNYWQDAISTQNADGTELTISTMKIDSGVMTEDGDGMLVRFSGKLKGSTSLKRLKVHFGAPGLDVLDTGAMTVATDSDWSCEIHIVRMGIGDAQISVTLNVNGKTPFVSTYFSTSELDFSAGTTVSILGTSSGTGVGAGDLSGNSVFGLLLPATSTNLS